MCDMAQAYHQCQISPKYTDLFAFKLSQENCSYKRCPMGFSDSGDHMVQVTDKILENLENVNDCLVKSNNKEDMRPGRVLRPFLERWSRRIDLDKDYCWGGSFLCRT